MNIFYLSHRVPYPPDKGDRIRAYHIIRHLARRHTVRLACLAWSLQEKESAKALEAHCQSVDVALMHPRWSKAKSLGGLFTRRPLTLSYFHSPGLEDIVRRRLGEESADAIVAFSSSMAQYVPPGGDHIRIMDFVDADSDKWLQYADYVRFPVSAVYRLEGHRLRRYEISIAPHFDCCTVISEAEAGLFRLNSDRFVLRVIPNGVDLEYFRPDREASPGQGMIFVGVMDYYANADGILYFCDQILPLIHRRVPQATLAIVGSHPTAAVRRLGRRRNVTVLGYVPDVRPSLREAAVCVVPLRIARGVQNKILEAMASGLPVVATRRAVEGIELEPGRDLLVADDPEEFAARTVELLMNRGLREELSRRGRAVVEKKYHWEECLRSLDGILDEFSGSGHRRRGASDTAPSSGLGRVRPQKIDQSNQA